MSRMASAPDLDARIERSFTLAVFATNRYIIEHMRRITMDLGLDFESAYLWGILGHLNIISVVYPGARAEDVLGADGFLAKETSGLKLADLSQISGIPRETVRRKLGILEAMGRVEHSPDGLWMVTKKSITPELYEFTKETVRRLLRAAAEVEAILERSPI